MGKGPKKSLKANVASLSTSFLRFVNMVIVAAAIGTIVLMFVINPTPTGAGVGFITLGFLVILSGAFGTIGSGQVGCFGCHMVFLTISSAGLIAAFASIFLKFDAVIYNLWPSIAVYDAKQYLRAAGATYFVLFACQLVVLLLACMIQVCGFLEYNEDIDAIAASRQVARMHADDEYRRARMESLTTNPISAHTGSSNNKLVEKMKAKYSQWTRKENAPAVGEYDMENARLGESSGPNSHTYAA